MLVIQPTYKNKSKDFNLFLENKVYLIVQRIGVESYKNCSYIIMVTCQTVVHFLD
jgi:hypothetical protein